MRRHKTINRRRLDVWKTIFKRRCTPVLQVILFRRSSIILCRCFSDFWKKLSYSTQSDYNTHSYFVHIFAIMHKENIFETIYENVFFVQNYKYLFTLFSIYTVSIYSLFNLLSFNLFSFQSMLFQSAFFSIFPIFPNCPQ